MFASPKNSRYAFRSTRSRSVMSEHTFVDLFCGIGGMRLGFEKAGCRCLFSADWDKYAKQTYAANFGDIPAGNIREVASSDIPEHDILTAGFPCQPFSISGVSKKNSLGRVHGFAEVNRMQPDSVLFLAARSEEH